MSTSVKRSNFYKIATYGAADYMGGSANQIIGLYYFLFLTTVAGLSPLLAGIVTGIGRIWDGLIDPAMGVLVDRTHKKMGSVRFLMLCSLIPIVISHFLFWSSFDLGNNINKSFYFTFAYILWSTSYSLATVPYDSLLPRIVPEYGARTNYAISRMIFSGIGGVSATFLYELFIPVSSEKMSPALASNYSIMGFSFGLFFVAFVLITALTVKEPPDLLKSSESKLSVKLIFKQYADVLKCKTYRKFFTLVLCGAFISGAILTAMMMFLMLIYGGIENFFLAFSLSFIVVTLKGAFEIGFFIPNMLMMKKYNKHRPYLIDIPMLIAAGILILFINATTPLWVFLIAISLLGAGVSCLGFVPSALLPDLADAQELIKGKKNEGVNAGINTFGKQVVGGLSTLVFGIILSAFGLDSVADKISPQDATIEAIWAVKVMLAIVPIVMCVVIFFVSRTYKLDGRAHALIKKLITERHEKGFVNPTEDEKSLLTEITGVSYNSMWISTVESEKSDSNLETSS
ncbi:MAG: MFS transporter [Christensenellaceae bacterium]|jgi:Na+/melibiose symporter-like transporter|nr:MFS transporter [Christensenellaceae bacterium]